MAGTLDYSTTAGSNTTVGGVSVAEGMTPGGVNNAMRAMMADSRKWQLDWSGVTTAGSSNAYTMTCNQGIAAYADGMRFSFRADRNNTDAATLNIDGRGAKALRKVSGGALAALIADDIVEKAIYDVVYISADDVFVIVGINLSLTALGITASATELNYVDGVTSAIQTQLDAKVAASVLTTDGDILTRDAGIPARLAVGGEGEVLTVVSGAPAYAAPAPTGRVLLATKTASASATLEFTEFDNANYRYYEFELENVKPATDAVGLFARVSTNGGSSYDGGASDYAWAGQSYLPGGSDAGLGGLAENSMGFGGNMGNAAGERGYTGTIKMFNAGSAARMRLHAAGQYDNTAGQMIMVNSTGTRLADQDTDGFQFLFSSGNIASGTIRMYGLP